MRIEYDPALIEQAVFLAAQGDASLHTELHAATDPLYELHGQQERRQRFEEVYKSFFLRLGLHEVIPAAVAERPLIADSIALCLVCEADRRKAESAELYVKKSEPQGQPSSRKLLIKMRPQSLQEHAGFVSRLRRELLHVADMLDDEFHYQKDSLTGHTPRTNLLRDRFRVLWEIYVEGRLFREGHRDEGARSSLSHMMERVFCKYDTRLYVPAFEHLFQATRLTHDQLLQWASSPERLFGAPQVPESDGRRAPGELCPLCGFSTFDWFDHGRSTHEMELAVRKDYPQWLPEQGVCGQCAEIYLAVCQQC